MYEYISLSDADLHKLAQLLNTGAMFLSKHWNLRIPQVRDFLDNMCQIVRELSIELGARTIAFEISEKPFTLDPVVSLSARNVADFLVMGHEVFRLDLDFQMTTHPDLDIADRTDICNYSEDKENVFFLVEGSGIIIICKGVQKQYVNVYSPGSREPRLSRYSRSFREYRQLIYDHQKVQLPAEMDHIWADRRNRILVSKNTEKIFQYSLWRWLHVNVNDARVVGEVKSISPEKTDIEMIGLRGGTHILEIKWLGKTTSGRYRYSRARIRTGIQQIKNYLDRDPHVSKAVLVCYDGRSRDDFMKDRNMDATDCGPRGDLLIMYVPSEAASEVGATSSAV